MSVFYSKFQMEGKSGGLVKLIRPNILLFLVIYLGVMEKWVVEPILSNYQIAPQLTWWQLALLIAAVVLIAAGGFVVNDYFDVKIDAINRPDELIVTNGVSKQEAMRFFQILTGLGIICGLIVSYLLKSMALATTFIFVPGILWFYSSSYKRIFLVGNLIVAFLSALAPLTVAIANDAALKLYFGEDGFAGLYLSRQAFCWIGAFAVVTFLCMWIRETVKDIQDQNGDRELECHTFPVKYGDLATKIFATVLIFLACGVISYFNFVLLPIAFSWGNFASRFYLLLLVAFACEIGLLWSAKLPSDYKSAQVLMTFILFMVAMYSFCVPKILDAASL